MSVGGLVRKAVKGAVLASNPAAALLWKRERDEVRRVSERHDRLRTRPTDLARFAEDNARLAASPDPMRVVLLGASITEEMDASRVGPSAVNRGVSGELVWQQLLRFRADVLALEPGAVVLKACAVNFGQGAPDAGLVKEHVAWMAELASSRGIRPILATTVPITAAYDRESPGSMVAIRAFNGWVRLSAARRGYTVADYEAALGTDRGFLGPELSTDGLHLTAAGYGRMVDVARAAIDRAFAEPAPGSARIASA
ncbi:MAG: GDSL family lipase [Deltaproteobacteria bacterium]|nr:GDSL family lipase [Deltaproteobacteria bacterium]